MLATVSALLIFGIATLLSILSKTTAGWIGGMDGFRKAIEIKTEWLTNPKRIKLAKKIRRLPSGKAEPSKKNGALSSEHTLLRSEHTSLSLEPTRLSSGSTELPKKDSSLSSEHTLLPSERISLSSTRSKVSSEHTELLKKDSSLPSEHT